MPYLPIAFMLVSILLYSLFPLVGVFGTVEVSGFAFAGLGHVLSAVVSILGAIWLSRGGECYNLRNLVRDFSADRVALREAALSGVINYFSHAFLFVSFAYISKASATVMFEAWPVLAVFFLVAFKRDFSGGAQPQASNRIGARVYFLSLVAFLGLIVIMAGDLRTLDGTGAWSELWRSPDAKIGVTLAVLSAVFMAYSVALGRNTRLFVEHRYGHCGRGRSELNRALIASAATKVFGALGFALTVPFVPGILPDIVGMGAETWSWVIINGVVIVTIGSLTYREALARTDRMEIAILWYMTPVFALMWLLLAGVEVLTITVGVGALLIVSANALLHMRADTTPAFIGVFLSVGASGVIVTMTSPVALENFVGEASLLDLVALPIGFIGILAGFLLQRISTLHSEARHSALCVIDYLAISGKQLKSTEVIALLHQRNSLPEAVQSHARRLQLGRIPIIRPGELLVIWTLSTFAVVCITMFRSESVVGDALAVLVSASLVYIVLHLTFDARIEPEQVVDTMLRKEYDAALSQQNAAALVVIGLVSVGILVLSHLGHIAAVPAGV